MMLIKNMFFSLTSFIVITRQLENNPPNGCFYPINQYTPAKCVPSGTPMPQMPLPQPIPQIQPAQQAVPVELKPVKVTTRITEGPKPEKSPLDRLIEMSPDLGRKIKKVFEYNGIADPWPQFSDIVSADQHKLPDPCMLYTKMKDILKVFESLKEMISDELLKIETYVKRAKSYLKEDQEKLKRDIDRMEKYMDKIKKSQINTVKTEYAKKFTETHSKAAEEIDQYQKLKKWLVCTLNYFKALF